MHLGQLLHIDRANSDLNRSAKSQDLTDTKKSKTNIVSSSKDELLQTQIIQLKQKAHQSFMQVIQIQQLHEQEMQAFREEYNLKCDQYENKIQVLKSEIKNLEQQNVMVQKNYRHHLYEFQKDNLSLDNIEPIYYQEESKLDDSAILNFNQIIEIHGFKQKMYAIKEEIKNQILFLIKESLQSQKINAMIQKLFEYISHLNRQFINLHETNLKLKTQNQLKTNKQIQDIFKSQNKGIKQDYENAQKENKFISEKLKRLSSDKMKIEKILAQKEKKYMKLEECLNKIVAYLHQNGLKISHVLKLDIDQFLGRQNDRSLDINEFIEQQLSKKPSQMNKVELGIIKKIRSHKN